jgi:hypothetical protein
VNEKAIGVKAATWPTEMKIRKKKNKNNGQQQRT